MYCYYIVAAFQVSSHSTFYIITFAQVYSASHRHKYIFLKIIIPRNRRRMIGELDFSQLILRPCSKKQARQPQDHLVRHIISSNNTDSLTFFKSHFVKCIPATFSPNHAATRCLLDQPGSIIMFLQADS